MEHSIYDRWKPLIPSFVFLAAFGFALLGLNPTFFLDDSPETITASLTLGIPHPPGYPLHTLLGHLISALPLGHWPFRVNLLSAVLASSVSIALFFFIRDLLEVSTVLSFIFSLFWIVGATTYPGALSAKTGIYHLTALFLITLLGAILKERWAWAAFLLGLSLTNHWMSMVAFLPGLGLLAYFQWRKGINLRIQIQTTPHPNPLPQGAREPRIQAPYTPSPSRGEGRGEGEKIQWVIFLSFFLIGLSLYLFLPLRARLNPLLNWGDPSTFDNFLFNFLRRQYGGGEGNGGPVAWVSQWVAFGQTMFLEFGGLLLLALWGWSRMRAQNSELARGLGLTWIGLPVLVGLYLNLPRDQYFLIPEYALASQVFILLFAAWGVEKALLGNPEQAARWRRWVWGLLAVFLVGMGLYRYDRQRQTNYTATYDYVLNSLQDLPRRALYFCRGDGIVFPSWYFQWVEGKRPDVAFVGVDALPMEWIRRNTAFLHRDLKVPFTKNPLGNESIPSLARWMVEHNGDRPLYFSYNQIGDGLVPGVKPAPYGLDTEGFLPPREPELEEARADACWNAMRLRNLVGPGFPLDARTREQVFRNYGIFRNTLGFFYEDRADDVHARLNPHSTAADLFGIRSDYEKSLGHYQWAQAWEPENPQYAFNTGNALCHLGRLADSLAWYEKAVQLDKGYAMAYFNGAVAAYQLGQFQRAGEWFRKVLDLKPDDAEAKRGLEALKKGGLYSPPK